MHRALINPKVETICDQSPSIVEVMRCQSSSVKKLTRSRHPLKTARYLTIAITDKSTKLLRYCSDQFRHKQSRKTVIRNV